ncbi:MAG: tetratricopeptide repeat protein [Candidatus Omnitrophica bacterium]|jgi:tetratricopeptide (TPR) repeat protein|nr:tetratricopeptide repeat protein [Candidatus Omnitrophota bacterium]
MLKVLLIALNLVSFYITAQADTIYLKSGKVLEACILEENTDYIKIDFNGNPLYYQKKYIAKIEKSILAENADSGTEKQNAGLLVNDYFKKGLEAAAEGDFTRARQEFNSGILKSEDDHNIPAALSLLDDLDSGKISRTYALDLFNGLFSMLCNDYKQAISYFKLVLEIDPVNIDALYNLGVCYYSLDNFHRAIDVFESILNIRPDDPEVYGLLGNAYYLTGDFQSAKKSFVLARELFRKAQDISSSNEIEKLLTRLFMDQSSK